MAVDVLQQSPSSSPSSSFEFDHGRSSPFLSTPPSPKGFGFSFFSTPSSPARGFHDSDPFDAQPRSSKHGDQYPLAYSPLRHRQTPERKKSSSIWSTLSPLRKKSSKPSSEQERGRDRVLTSSTSSSSSRRSGRREARSLSPEKRKWSLKDLLLFRSASEGRGSDKDPFKKYSTNDGSTSSKNLTTTSGESSTSKSNKKAQVSAHELHYKTNKAISQDMRKKSFLPYKQGILGRLAIAHGFGSPVHNQMTKFNY